MLQLKQLTHRGPSAIWTRMNFRERLVCHINIRVLPGNPLHGVAIAFEHTGRNIHNHDSKLLIKLKRFGDFNRSRVIFPLQNSAVITLMEASLQFSSRRFCHLAWIYAPVQVWFPFHGDTESES
ncbi:hypothetical protein D3C81_1621740 [compost metagenome]